MIQKCQKCQKWMTLVSVACGTFMATLDSSIVNIALPTLTKDLGPDLYRVKWVVIVYLLMITCLLLPVGKLSDQKGRKNIFRVGFFVFVLGSALCGLSWDLNGLVLSRAVQAIGAAMLMANGPAIITSAFSSRERGMAPGMMAMVVSLGLVTGPSLGGFLISQIGWRSIFFINIPVGTLGILMVHHYVKNDLPMKSDQPFDWVGTILQTILLLLFMMFFDPPQVLTSGEGAKAVFRGLLGLFFIIITLVFIRVERGLKAPLFDLNLLKNRTFWTANLAGFLTFVAFSSVSVLMPFFLEEVLHLSPKEAGLFMTAIPLTIFVVAPISGKLSDRLGGTELSFAGCVIGSLGLFIMAGAFGLGIHEGMRSIELVITLCLMGLAIGLFQSPNNNAIMGVVPIGKLGVASALLATVRNLGLVTGTGLATSVYTWRLSSTGDSIAAFHSAYLVAGVVSVGAMIASLGKRRGPIGG